MTTQTITPPETPSKSGPMPTVGEVMHPGIVSCGQSARPAEIARIMASCRVHCVAVMGFTRGGREDPMIWGIVSDLDLLEAMTETGTETSAGDLARQPVITMRPTMSVRDAAQAMVSNHTQHIVVVDPERLTPLGIVSSLDLAEVLARPNPPKSMA